MAENLFSEIIAGQVGLDCFQQWLTGKKTQVINDSVSRTEFVLTVLKCIQEESTRFIPTPSTTPAAQVKVKDSKALQKNPPDKKPQGHESNASEDDFRHQRLPFQVINRVTPTRTTFPQHFARYVNHGSDIRRESQPYSSGQDNRNVLTSTPIYARRNDYFPISPNSFHSDHSSLSQTPRSSKSSKFNSSGSPHSPQSPSFSPTSSNYSDNFPDLSGRSRSRVPQSPCLGDFIAIKPASQKSRKRIKPTQLSTSDKDVVEDCKKGNKSFGTIDRPYNNLTTSSQAEVKEQSNFDEERNLLKQKRIQILKFSEAESATSNLPSTTLKVERSPSIQEEQNLPKVYNSQCLNIVVEQSVTNLPSSSLTFVPVNPDPGLVKCVKRIGRLATVYSACLDANIVPNVISELYNIFTLLTATYKSKTPVNVESTNSSQISEDTQDMNCNSGHCNNLLENLCLNDNMLQDESSVSGQDTSGQAKHICNHRKSKTVLSSVHDCVMFSVAVLEKQIHTLRCLEKGILRLLIENTRLSLFAPHLIPQLISIAESKEVTETSSNLAKKSFPVENGPVLYHSETDSKVNFTSDLNFNFFKKQRDGFYEILHEWRLKNSDNVWASKRFPLRVQSLLAISNDPVNMMHLARLFCSQLTSSKTEQSEEELDLPGVSKDKLSRLQARFSKPSEGTSSPRPPPSFPAEQMFYQQFLQLAVGSTFLHHVADFLIYRINLLDHADFFVDGLSTEEIKSQILTSVSDCCLLAKFLGLVVFLPYKSNSPLMPDTLQAQILIREQVVSPVNVMPHLERALSSNRLVITLPWVVAYLGMMDHVAPYLTSYHALLQLLTSIYRALPFPHMSPLSNLLLRCSLGWLFDTSFFPQHVFYSMISSNTGLESRNLIPTDADVKDVVDQTLLSKLCPYLSHLRQLLTLSASSKQGVVRHITPVPVQLTPTTQTSFIQTMELQLEECFLSGQSTSFRSTVEMIIDRVSSSCIKNICSKVIAPVKEEASSSIKKQKEIFKNKKKQDVQVWVSEQCRTTEAKIEEVVAEHCNSKIKTALVTLLEPDISDPAISDPTHAICARRCRERIINWLNSHIKLTEMFLKLIPAPEAKPTVDLMKPLRDNNSVEHKETAAAPADLMIELQDKLCECIETRGTLMSEKQVLSLTNKAVETIKHRNDLIAIARNVIFSLSVDFCIVLLAHAPQVVTEPVVMQLCTLWTMCQPQSGGQLERLMSARNTLLLCQSGAARAHASWQRLSSVLVELLKQSLLTPPQLEAQCVALFRLDWPPMVLTFMGTCLSSMVEQIKQDPIFKQKPKFILMLEWVKEMTEDLSRGDIFEDL